MMQAQVEITTGLILAVGLFPAGSPDAETIAVVDLTPLQEASLTSPGSKVLNGDGTITVTPPELPDPETPPASILLLMLEDVTDVDESKPILQAILVLLGGTLPEV